MHVIRFATWIPKYGDFRDIALLIAAQIPRVRALAGAGAAEKTSVLGGRPRIAELSRL